MRNKLEERLKSLRSEFEAGQLQLKSLDKRAEDLKVTLLRISGALQVLEELLGETTSDSPPQSQNS